MLKRADAALQMQRGPAIWRGLARCRVGAFRLPRLFGQRVAVAARGRAAVAASRDVPLHQGVTCLYISFDVPLHQGAT